MGMYEIISRKRDGGELTQEEIADFVQGFVSGAIPDYQAAALLMAVYLRGMSPRELAQLTEAMLRSGETIPLEHVRARKIDKHSTGGVGDKVSFVVAPLVASLGISVPMLSGRGLGHTGGTLDKLESIPRMNVFLSVDRFRQVLAEVGMAICGQTERIVPADKKLYALRDTTATVSSIPLIASSIMSKKLALGTDGIVLDVKTGSGAFMRGRQESLDLCQTMVEIGERVGRPTIGLITNMDRPLGRAVGNALEIVESLECLKGRGPEDVMQVTFALGWAMLEAAGQRLAFADAQAMFRGRIASGEALEKFRSFIRAQGGDDRVCDDYSLLPRSPHALELPAWESGFITRIDAFEVGMAAIDVGAGRRKKEDPIDPAAGFVFHRNRGDEVCRGEALLTVHAADRGIAHAVLERLKAAIVIAAEAPARQPLVFSRVDKSGIHPWRD